MSARISIIIPVYNQHQELDRALDSIAAQTYADTDIIIVDDGSDPPIDIDRIRQKNANVAYIRQKNSGAPAARNRGLAEAKGEYIIFWDADVIAEPIMLETMAAALDAHPEAAYAYCHYYFGWKKMPARSFDTRALAQANYIHTTSLIRRSVLKRDPWDTSLRRFQDWDLWLSLLEDRQHGLFVPKYLFRIVPHAGGISFWLPACAYRRPWRFLPGIATRVRNYEAALDIVRKKWKQKQS